MPRQEPLGIDTSEAPFDRLKGVRVLGTNRSGRDSAAHARHQLYVGRDRATSAQMLVKVTTRPGVFYERNLANEADVLAAINRALPASRTFPVLVDRGRLKDGRLFLMTYLFEEFALAMSISAERLPMRLYDNLRIGLAVASSLTELHSLPIYHVDLNPMNILYRSEHGSPVIRMVDFESAFDPARHTPDAFYDPPTTANYSAPELAQHRPDARADVFSLGAVLYTMLAGFDWEWKGDAQTVVEADTQLDPALQELLLLAVARDPEHRFASSTQLRNALATYVEQTFPGRLER
ncbi:MAG: protein kinase [Vicinamibacterales bacterium]